MVPWDVYGLQWNTALHGLLIIMRILNLFWSEQKLSQSFSYLKNPVYTATVNMGIFGGMLASGLTLFHCTLKFIEGASVSQSVSQSSVSRFLFRPE